MRTTAIWFAACVCCLGGAFATQVHAQASEPSTLTPAAPEVAADATERARLHFKNGVDFYRERNFRAALIEFKRAFKASPHYKLLYNLGQASLELQEDSSAIDYFTNYLGEGGTELDLERRREVEQTIAKLQARLATATITVNQPGAEIFADETLLGTSPLSGPIKISAGRRRFSAVKRGFPTAELTMDVAAGDHVTIALDIKDRAPDLAKLRRELMPLTVKEDGTLSPAAWTAIGTGVIAAGAITMTVLTALAQKDYDNERKHKTSASELSNIRDDAKLKALVADICWGATIVAGGVTAVLLLTDTGHEQAPSEKDSNGIKVDLGAGSVHVRGQF